MVPVCACSYIYISRHIRDVGYSCVCRVFEFVYVTHHLHQPQILYGCQGKIASGKVTDWALAARACVYVVVVCTLHMSTCRRGRHMSRYVDICLDMCRRTTVWTLHMSRWWWQAWYALPMCSIWYALPT